ncbi:uncharacterized protein LOC133196556 [Saccostrea echinata]|uniref:uncharacterized protein LOC133196556 n=1 Tax=Saccostrea echinata TaxID=191078 RepID=UPI002A818EC1|nr:uncharacterized protein LOC133196556 [Saccostrea echinata]
MSPKLIRIFCVLHICNVTAIPIERSITTSTPDPKALQRDGCEYDGKHYEPGVIRKDKHGSCESVLICEEGGGVAVSDSSGCIEGRFDEITTIEPEIKNLPEITTVSPIQI